MRLYTAAVIAPLFLGLAACDPRAADSPKAATPPADAPADTPAAAPDISAEFGSSFRLIGTEPFWALKVGQSSMVLSRPDHAEITVAHSGPTGRDGQAQWSGDGLTATVTRQTCSDGMSDRVYRYEAIVETGGATLKGCADIEAMFAP